MRLRIFSFGCSAGTARASRRVLGTDQSAGMLGQTWPGFIVAGQADDDEYWHFLLTRS
jgi:hypothetical protein